MITLHLVGIGTGNPDHMTRAAIKALSSADLILLPRKSESKSDLADLRRAICDEVVVAPNSVVEYDMPERDASGAYLGAVDEWHRAIAAIWGRLIATHLPRGGSVALMVWGDPSLYDGSLRIAARLKAGGMEVRTRVVPGISSLSVLSAAHAIPLNSLGAPVLITTGRRIRDGGWPAGVDSVAVMLDAGSAFEVLDPTGVDIWWGAYLGLPQEALIAGPLVTVAGQIINERARLRAEHGWIMDIYLMRKEAT